MGLYDLVVAVLMLVNAVAILNEERFLAKCAREPRPRTVYTSGCL